MTLTEYQNMLHALYEKDSDYPSSTDEDWTVRTQLANAAIHIWEHETGVFWNELFIDLSDAADGDTTTTASTSAYDAPSDFIIPAGQLKITDSDGDEAFYPYEKNYKKALDWGSADKFYYVTGNKSAGHKIHIHPTPSETGSTISYQYYKEADELSDASDVFEMSDPTFVVYWTLAELQAEEGRGAEALQVAMSKLRAMKIKNMASPYYSDDLMDLTDTQTGFGR